MKKRILFIFVVYIFLCVSGSIFAVGESAIVLGGESTWKLAEYRTGITELQTVRPHPVLVLSSTTGNSVNGYSAAAGVLGNFTSLTGSALDLSISFDERNTGLYRDSVGSYRVSVSPEIEAVDTRLARAGTGAALFNGNGSVSVEPRSGNALFYSDNRIRDFTIEFWLYPQNMENGEQILSWVSEKPQNGNFSVQRIQCFVSKNRLSWSFINFFASARAVGGDTAHLNIEFSGNTPVVPKTWSHHLIRFDSSTGMIEYLVNGVSETIVYATATGRENSEVYTPVAGRNGIFRLCERFMGLMDEFKIHNVCAGRSSVQKYALSGGRAETGAIDLGTVNSGVIRIDASGGRINISGNGAANEFRENGRLRFSDNSEMNFFIRTSENPYLLNESPWISFTPGAQISGIQGRYVQVAVDFYPSADGETSPYLYDLRIIYRQGEPPLPPGNVTAVAADGGVLLRWRNSPDINTAGYLVYYSSVRGELFGNDALAGASPIDAGNRNSLFIPGLKNGTLYYFRIAAYDYIFESAERNPGEFSAEVMARPLSGLSLSEILPNGMEASSARR